VDRSKAALQRCELAKLVGGIEYEIGGASDAGANAIRVVAKNDDNLRTQAFKDADQAIGKSLAADGEQSFGGTHPARRTAGKDHRGCRHVRCARSFSFA
jgi:hypothetical protein